MLIAMNDDGTWLVDGVFDTAGFASVVLGCRQQMDKNGIICTGLTGTLATVTAFASPLALPSTSMGLPVPFASTLGFLVFLESTGKGKTLRLASPTSSVLRPSRLLDSFLSSGRAAVLSTLRFAGLPLVFSSIEIRRALADVDDWPC